MTGACPIRNDVRCAILKLSRLLSDSKLAVQPIEPDGIMYISRTGYQDNNI